MDDKARTRMIVTTALTYGAHPTGLEDLQHRVEAHFGAQDFDSLALGRFLHDLRTIEAPHLFRAGATASPPPAPVSGQPSTEKPRRPPPPHASAAQLKAVEGLSPVEKLTKWREMEAEREAAAKGGRA